MYGAGRCLTEIFGVSLRGVLAGVTLASVVVLVVFVLLCFVRIAVKQSSCAGIFDFAASKILLVIFLGVVLSEAWISFDEYRFSRKTSYSGIMKEHRPRSFPFKGYDLHYENARGIWTTDWYAKRSELTVHAWAVEAEWCEASEVKLWVSANCKMTKWKIVAICGTGTKGSDPSVYD